MYQSASREYISYDEEFLDNPKCIFWPSIIGFSKLPHHRTQNVAAFGFFHETKHLQQVLSNIFGTIEP